MPTKEQRREERRLKRIAVRQYRHSQERITRELFNATEDDKIEELQEKLKNEQHPKT